MKTSLYNVAKSVQTLAPAARTTTANGTAVDRHNAGRGAFRSALLVVNAGTVTDGTHTVELQDSDNGTDFTAVANEFLQGSEPAITTANDLAVHEVGYTGSRRYLRCVITVSGSPSTGGVIGASIQLGYASQPVVRP